jgi:hypothetical protein
VENSYFDNYFQFGCPENVYSNVHTLGVMMCSSVQRMCRCCHVFWTQFPIFRFALFLTMKVNNPVTNVLQLRMWVYDYCAFPVAFRCIATSCYLYVKFHCFYLTFPKCLLLIWPAPIVELGCIDVCLLGSILKVNKAFLPRRPTSTSLPPSEPQI